MENAISRRNFLIGGATAALGGLALAGCSADDTLAATGDAATPVLPETWDKEVDVVVVGSGSILPAALKAYAEGMEVLILEKHPTHFGGTSYFHGGGCSCPNSTKALEMGQLEIPRDLCKRYMEESACGQSNDAIIEGLLDNYVPAIDFLADEYDLPISYFNRPNSAFTLYTPHSCLEEEYAGVSGHAVVDPYDDLTMGRAWTSYFKDAIDECGIEVMMGTAGKKLIYRGNPMLEDGEVVGIYAETADGTLAIKARRGVILGTGGFDHNKEMVDHFLPNPMFATIAVETNTGDGHLMAMEVGADLHNMRESFRMAFTPTAPEMNYQITRPETDEGTIASEQQTGKMINTAGRPGSLIVNKYGERFVNESAAYDLFGKGFEAYDTGMNDWRNIPGFLIFDGTYSGPLGHGMPTLAQLAETGAAVPDYVGQYDSLEELASDKGIDTDNLLATVERFNGFCATGVDKDWHRGEASWDRFTCGDLERFEAGELKNPCMSALVEGPFYCLELYPGMMQTKGGLVINEHAQVLNTNGNVIPRLYAGSNTIANPLGRGYGWGGATIANGYIVGYMAADHISTLSAWDEEA